MARLVVTYFPQSIWFLILDDTFVYRCSKKAPGSSIHHQHGNKSKAPPAERVASGSPLKGGEQQSTSFAACPLSCSRAPQKLPKKEFELFEHPARGYKLREFSNSRQVRGVPFQGINSGNPSESGANDWCPFFWFVFFGHAKKMNRFILSSPDR